MQRSKKPMPAALLLTAALVLQAPPAAGHEVPSDVTVRILVLQETDLVTLLVRVPLAALRDFEWPLRGPGYLDLDRTGELLGSAVRTWIVGGMGLESDRRPLPEPELRRARISLPSSRAFSDPEQALAHLSAPDLPATTAIAPGQALVDVWLEVPVASDATDFSLNTSDLARLGLRTTTVVRFVTHNGTDRIYRFDGDMGRVSLDPGWYQAAWSFLVLGFWHILGGIDHLLFLVCLVLPYRRVRPLVPIVTSFTVAHSVTLTASALGLAPAALWFPALIETLIALSIVVMAIDNVVGPRLEHRWLVAFGFGLVHGFGFSFALGESLQFAGSHLLSALLAFNLGVELGQLLVLAALVPALAWLGRWIAAERTTRVLVSVLVAHTAWHWLTDRAADLRQYRLVWPALDSALLARGMRWAALGLLLLGVGWALSELFTRWRPRGPESRPDDAGEPDPGC